MGLMGEGQDEDRRLIAEIVIKEMEARCKVPEEKEPEKEVTPAPASSEVTSSRPESVQSNMSKKTEDREEKKDEVKVKKEHKRDKSEEKEARRAEKEARRAEKVRHRVHVYSTQNRFLKEAKRERERKREEERLRQALEEEERRR